MICYKVSDELKFSFKNITCAEEISFRIIGQRRHRHYKMTERQTQRETAINSH